MPAPRCSARPRAPAPAARRPSRVVAWPGVGSAQVAAMRGPDALGTGRAGGGPAVHPPARASPGARWGLGARGRGRGCCRRRRRGQREGGVGGGGKRTFMRAARSPRTPRRLAAEHPRRSSRRASASGAPPGPATRCHCCSARRVPGFPRARAAPCTSCAAPRPSTCPDDRDDPVRLPLPDDCPCPIPPPALGPARGVGRAPCARLCLCWLAKVLTQGGGGGSSSSAISVAASARRLGQRAGSLGTCFFRYWAGVVSLTCRRRQVQSGTCRGTQVSGSATGSGLRPGAR